MGARTGSPAVARARFTIFGEVRGETAEQPLADLGPDTLIARSGSMVGVLHTGDSLVDRVAEVTGVEKLFAKLPP